MFIGLEISLLLPTNSAARSPEPSCEKSSPASETASDAPASANWSFLVIERSVLRSANCCGSKSVISAACCVRSADAS